MERLPQSLRQIIDLLACSRLRSINTLFLCSHLSPQRNLTGIQEYFWDWQREGTYSRIGSYHHRKYSKIPQFMFTRASQNR